MPDNARYYDLKRELELIWLKRERRAMPRLRPIAGFPAQVGMSLAQSAWWDQVGDDMKAGKINSLQAAARVGKIRGPVNLKEWVLWWRNRPPEVIEAELAGLPEIVAKAGKVPQVPASIDNDGGWCFQGCYVGSMVRHIQSILDCSHAVRLMGGWRDKFIRDPRWLPLRTAGAWEGHPGDRIWPQPLDVMASEIEFETRNAWRDTYGGRESEELHVLVPCFSVKLSRSMCRRIAEDLKGTAGRYTVYFAICFEPGERAPLPAPCAKHPRVKYTLKAMRLFAFDINGEGRRILLAKEYEEHVGEQLRPG
ncbi:MAG: hypothetical protein PHX82_02135 [Paracoccaceae bacterium]|nr:hypothetical protein [Paracoccaceae bacterium]